MRVTAVSIKNILGLGEYRLEPGTITRLSGHNSAGKSSVLGAIQAALQGGSLASVQRVDKETGLPTGDAEVQIVFDDGEYRLEREGAETKVFERVDGSRGEKKTPRPASFIDGIFDRDLSNPLNFLDGTPAKRLDWLLQVLPLELGPEQVREAVGDELWPLVEKDATAGHPLQVLTAVRRTIFEARTGINVSRDDKEATRRQIELTIPAKMPAATPDGVVGLEKRRDEVADRVQKAKAAADHALTEKNTAARAAYDNAVQQARGDGASEINAFEGARDQKIAKLRAAFDKAVAEETRATQEAVDAAKRRVVELQDGAQQKLAAAQGDAESERQAAVAAIVADEQELSTITADLARAREQVEGNAKMKTQIELVEKFKAEVESLKGKSERYTAGLDAVDALKGRLLAALPFPGLEIDGKDIYLSKVPLATANTAQCIVFATKVAALRAKKRGLPVLFVDNAEALDAENLALLEDTVIAEGCQAFIAIRTEGTELTVQTR